MPDTTENTILLVGGTVITVDEDRQVLEPGAVAVEGDEILETGDRDRLLENYPDADHIDLSHTVILPGLVDSHGHAGHGLTKGLGGGDGEQWMSAVQDVYFQASDETFWRKESYLSALEHLEVGVTTSISYTGSSPRVDDPKYAEAAAEGYAALGLRHIVNLGPPDPPYPKSYYDVSADETITADLDHAIETTAKTIDRLHGTEDGRISVFVGPSSLVPEVNRDGHVEQAGLIGGGTFKPAEGDASEIAIDQMVKVADLAEEHDVNIHTHAFGGQVRAAAESVPEILSPSLSLAHCAGLTEKELELMAEHGVSASHGPLTHAYAMARFPLVEALDAGVNVAISTDGSAPDRSFDLLSQGRIAAQLQRVHFNDTSVLPAGKILEMMTIDAAKALGMADQVGSIEAGKKADIIAIDLRSARLRPHSMPLHRIVHHASGVDTEFVMVDGEVLMRDRSFEHLDTERILADADEAARETFARAGVVDQLETTSNTWRRSRY